MMHLRSILRSRYGVSTVALMAGFSAAGASHADEKGLIWSPVKNSDQSYTARIGAKLPTPVPLRGGIEMGMNATKTGALVDAPVRFWGNMTLTSSALAASSQVRDVGVLMNALTGSSTVTMTNTVKEIVTPSLDLEANRNVSIRYDGTAQQWQGLDVSQSLRLTRADTGTAFVLKAASRETFDDFSTGVALEQKLGSNLTLSGTLDQGYEDHFRPAVNARYSIRW